MAEVQESQIPSGGGQELGPKLKELLLMQPLNPLRPLVFRELTSKEQKESLSAAALDVS